MHTRSKLQMTLRQGQASAKTVGGSSLIENGNAAFIEVGVAAIAFA